MLEFFKILFTNFGWCDILIVMLIFLNLIPVALIYMSCFRIKMQRVRDRIDDLSEPEEIDLKKLKYDRNLLSNAYYAFTGITSIFPLLGLLGTVVGIIQSDVMTSSANFMIALTSTFWGIIGSVVYKFVDAFISSTVESNIKSIDIYINEVTQENAKLAVKGMSEKSESGDKPALLTR